MSVEKHPCFVEANKALAASNTAISFVYMFTDMDVRLIVKTEKLDGTKRGKPKTLMASHCPFCGSSLIKAGDA